MHQIANLKIFLKTMTSLTPLNKIPLGTDTLSGVHMVRSASGFLLSSCNRSAREKCKLWIMLCYESVGSGVNAILFNML